MYTGPSEMRCNIDTDLVYVIDRARHIAVAVYVYVVERDRAVAIEEVFQAGGRGIVVVAPVLAEELVVFISGEGREHDVAPEFVIDAEHERLRPHAAGDRLDGLRRDLFGLELHVDGAPRAPRQQRTEGRTAHRPDGRIVEPLAGKAGADLAADQMRQVEIETRQRAVSVRAQGARRRALEVAQIAFECCEKAEIGAVCVIDPGLRGVARAVAAVLIDGRAVLGTRGAEIVIVVAQPE